MSTPAKVISKKGKKKPIPVKTSLNNPYRLQWSPLENEHVDFILNTLKDKITDVGLQKKRVKKCREWGSRRSRKKVSKCSEEDNKPAAESAESTKKPTEPCWTNVAVRKQLAIGINEVTKGLERNELSLVLVCNSVMPSHMTCHLIPLSKTRSVPACQVRRLSAHLAGLLGLKCVLALGFKRDAAEFADVVSAITPVVPPLSVAWVPTDSSPITTEVEGCSAEKHTDSAKGQKRKLEEISDEASEASPLILQPLKVKKIIPNPTKIRKQKKKK
ncbi:ribonuclease P protein subunit p38 [Myxocyprinus asiaticus]|uniref:ribonuclease P protein subunit p38 n=1 Tax=Myxocyprinus asiaticus TaxID=70543 RepID=UPI00222191BF|nr:ribonuclease P protein subunit p38 [Myxocyprinus asiaticus]